MTRVQFTADLMPSDITGSSIYNMATGDFKFIEGPIFTNVLFADEINRAPARTQSALLEAMQEAQVSVDGNTYMLQTPFFRHCHTEYDRRTWRLFAPIEPARSVCVSHKVVVSERGARGTSDYAGSQTASRHRPRHIAERF